MTTDGTISSDRAGPGPVAGSRLGNIRPRPLPAGRTLVLSGLLLLTAVTLGPLAIVGGGVPTLPGGWEPVLAGDGLALPWWALAPLFGLTGVFVFHVELKGEAQPFSLSEVPLVLGLFFATPEQLLLARLVGEAVVLLVHERQGPVKLTFNLSLFLAETVVALTVFRAIIGGLTVGHAAAWLVALAAAAAGSLTGLVTLWVVVRWHGGRLEVHKLLGAMAITTVCNTALASVAAVLLVTVPLAALPLLIVVAVVVAAYRGYTGLACRYAGLDMLYQFTRVTSSAMQPRETLASVLDEARRLLRADYAAVTLLPLNSRSLLRLAVHGNGLVGEPDGADLPVAVLDRVVGGRETVVIGKSTRRPELRAVLLELGLRDCLAAPLLSGGEVTGTILVGNRLGDVSTFDGEDARLFATLASQAGVALENGRLIDRLHEQAREREHEALHDALTGLPNRALFSRQVEGALADAASSGATVAVLLMDLDRFKEVNDTLGHHTGDQLLEQIGARLLRAVGERGLVARLGGDEFAVLLNGLDGSKEALKVARDLHQQVTEPVQLPTMLLDVGASIGISVRPDHGDDLTALLQRADVAMYACKRSQERVALYDPSVDWNSELRLRLAGEMRGALQRHQVQVHFQPIARLSDLEVVTAEALARWHHPELGLVGPDEFVPVAERTGQIEELTLYVLDTALLECRRWRGADLDVRVSVNLPVQVLVDARWPAKVRALLDRHRVPANRLMLEITETGIMSDPERSIGALRELVDAGVAFAIDDFGTGYSSLSYLQRLPVSTVKIDKSFIRPLVSDASAATIVRSVVDLARGLALDVVAEGVEDQRTLDHLRLLHCDYIQGYYLSRPIPAVELTEWLLARRRTMQLGQDASAAGPEPDPWPAGRALRAV
jgi:diguanylate cyclase (GGDEF)-like protein